MTTRSPRVYRPRSSSDLSTWRIMPSVLSMCGTMNVSVPQVSASWLRTSGSAVNASTGSGVCSRASRGTVLPDWVNATSALASSRSPMSRAA
jgi:hypothetical protein